MKIAAILGKLMRKLRALALILAVSFIGSTTTNPAAWFWGTNSTEEVYQELSNLFVNALPFILLLALFSAVFGFINRMKRGIEA